MPRKDVPFEEFIGAGWIIVCLKSNNFEVSFYKFTKKFMLLCNNSKHIKFLSKN